MAATRVEKLCRRQDEVSRRSPPRAARKNDVTGTRNIRTAAEPSRNALRHQNSSAFNPDQSSKRLTFSTSAHETSVNSAAAIEPELDVEIQPVGVNRTLVPDTRSSGSGEDSSRGQPKVTHPRIHFQSGDAKHIVPAAVQRSHRFGESERGHERESSAAGVCEGQYPAVADEKCTPPVNDRQRSKPWWSSAGDSSYPQQTKSWGTCNNDHSRVGTFDETVRPSSHVQSPLGVATRDRRCRNSPTVSTLQSSDPKPALDRPADTAAHHYSAQLKEDRTARRSTVSSAPGASSQDGRNGVLVANSNGRCPCPCHKQPTAKLHYAAGNSGVQTTKQTTAMNTRINRISSDGLSAAEATGRREDLSLRRITGRCGHFEFQADTCVDADENRSFKSEQGLKSAMANR